MSSALVEGMSAAAAEDLIPVTGFVAFEFETGERYEGCIRDLKLEGVGALRHADGSVYKGDFCEGFKCGLGMTQFPNGDKHVGRYEKNVFHGSGTFVSGDGSFKYVGEFFMGECHGEGTITYKGGVKYRGLFNMGQKEKGEYVYPRRSAYPMSPTSSSSSLGSPMSTPSSPGLTSGSDSE